MFINENEINYFMWVNGDDIGTIALFDEKIIRIINPQKQTEVKEMFACGLINELMLKNLLVETHISDYHIKEGDMILEHKKILPVTKVSEWSVDMAKDSAKMILELLLVLKKYGYDLKDIHNGNVLFDEGIPIWVDFGSIVKSKTYSIIGYRDFFVFHINPIYARVKGHEKFVKTLEAKGTYSYKKELHMLLHPLCTNRLYDIYENTWRRYLTIKDILWRNTGGGYKRSNFSKKLYGIIFLNKAISLFIKDIKKDSMKYQVKQIYKLQNYLRKIDNKKVMNKSIWGKYQDELKVEESRFPLIVNLLKKYDINSIFEIGANAGALARLAIKELDLDYYIASDFDPNAVNKCYCLLNDEEKKVISPIVFDVSDEEKLKLESSRFCCDCVMACALAHHLILAQYVNLDKFLKYISKYTKKFLVIEFMPLGLWDGKKDIASVTVPEWYTQEWFEGEINKYFNILEKKKIETNRVLIIAEKSMEDITI